MHVCMKIYSRDTSPVQSMAPMPQDSSLPAEEFLTDESELQSADYEVYINGIVCVPVLYCAMLCLPCCIFVSYMVVCVDIY